MKLRWAYVDSWEENAAVNKWILRQIDGMIAAEPQTNNGTTFS